MTVSGRRLFVSCGSLAHSVNALHMPIAHPRHGGRSAVQDAQVARSIKVVTAHLQREPRTTATPDLAHTRRPALRQLPPQATR